MTLFISTPCYGGMCLQQYAQSLLDLRGQVKFKIDSTVNESLISRARCLATERFVRDPDCDRMLFIDSDIGFPVEAVKAMIECDHDVAVVPYPKKYIFWDKAEKLIEEKGDVPTAEVAAASASMAVNKTHDGTVRDGATGFMMIKKEVILKMQEAYPELKVRNDHENATIPHYWGLFDTMIEPGPPGYLNRYLSEDYAFCRRWQKIGGKVNMLDPIPRLGHVGNLTFRSQYNLNK